MAQPRSRVIDPGNLEDVVPLEIVPQELREEAHESGRQPVFTRADVALFKRQVRRVAHELDHSGRNECPPPPVAPPRRLLGARARRSCQGGRPGGRAASRSAGGGSSGDPSDSDEPGPARHLSAEPPVGVG